MSKELYMEIHEGLIDKYLEYHPDATWAEACEATAGQAYDMKREAYADAVDRAREMAAREGRRAIISRERRI